MMVIAMLLAHLVGDYVLQWDRLARWKEQEFAGVFVHSLIILAVTFGFSLPFHQGIWWQGILFIAGTHFLVDWYQQRVKFPILPLIRFSIDQILHFTFIFVALIFGGYLQINSLALGLQQSLVASPIGTQLLAIAFVTMPAWVVVKFLAYALVKQSGPNFPEGTSKYTAILERLAIFASVIWGALLLVPILAIPRLVWEWSEVKQPERMSVYLVETAVSILLTIVIALATRMII